MGLAKQMMNSYMLDPSSSCASLLQSRENISNLLGLSSLLQMGFNSKALEEIDAELFPSYLEILIQQDSILVNVLCCIISGVDKCH